MPAIRHKNYKNQPSLWYQLLERTCISRAVIGYVKTILHCHGFKAAGIAVEGNVGGLKTLRVCGFLIEKTRNFRKSLFFRGNRTNGYYALLILMFETLLVNVRRTAIPHLNVNILTSQIRAIIV
jgi:hypothetical protein